MTKLEYIFLGMILASIMAFMAQGERVKKLQLDNSTLRGIVELQEALIHHKGVEL